MFTAARLAAWLSLSVIIAAGALAGEANPAAKLVGAQPGKLPIILSAPHGGAKEVPGVPPRRGEGLVKGSKGFFTGRDTGTEELAEALAAAIEKKMGKRPYVVVARFHRRYIDANRPPEIAYESKLAKPVYDEYHAALARYCKEVKKTYGRGLLLDVHGQGTARDTVFRGTQNGKTVTLLRQRFGEQAHTAKKSFFGLLAANGCKVHPEDGAGKERAGFTGGHIVRTYGSHEGYGIDAIQLEFGGDYRAKGKREDTARKVAAAVAEYARLYLEEKAKP
jgi:N-formylglutamate amidohydrolase